MKSKEKFICKIDCEKTPLFPAFQMQYNGEDLVIFCIKNIENAPELMKVIESEKRMLIPQPSEKLDPQLNLFWAKAEEIKFEVQEDQSGSEDVL